MNIRQSLLKDLEKLVILCYTQDIENKLTTDILNTNLIKSCNSLEEYFNAVDIDIYNIICACLEDDLSYESIYKNILRSIYDELIDGILITSYRNYII